MQLNIDPVIFYIAGYPILRWYSLAYILGFVFAYTLFKKYSNFTTKEQTESIFNYGFLGVILGGRLGYVLFYNLGYYIHNPLEIFAVWQGGMSFHGGLLGVIIALTVFAKKHNVSPEKIADIAPMCVTPGLFFGRIANFINGELWGATTNLPIGIIFPQANDFTPRHPTQLYEALTEGLLLFIITWRMYQVKQKLNEDEKIANYSIAAWFLILYGIFRFLIEFVRQPDAHIGYIAFGVITMGHILCLAMIISGAFWLKYGSVVMSTIFTPKD
jgi:phosphatidylglycerol:prolipoprotein diacylglycerol transferase